MSTSINTNISALAAQSSLRKTGLTQATAMERLSTGVRINSAKDDAAGLAISTRMTANIRGIAAAIRNANDGISLTQTAEGSLSAIGDNLQRIRELAVQSSNTGNSASDRSALNSEATQLIAEIDRVASNSAFNGIKLLDGSFQNQDLQIGAGNDANDRITVSIGNAKASALGVGGGSSYLTKNATAYQVTSSALGAGGITINGYSVGDTSADGVSLATDSANSAIAKANAINAISGTTGVTASVVNTEKSFTATSAGSTFTFTVNGVTISGTADTASAKTAASTISAAINSVSAQTGVNAAVDGDSGGYKLTAIDGRNIVIGGASSALSGAATVTLGTTYGKINLASNTSTGIILGGTQITSIGATAGALTTTTTAGAGVSTLDLSTASGAKAALNVLDKAINQITDSRASMGAYQNRLTAAISNLETTSTNLAASRSRILDTDYAKETTNLAKSQIITQAATAMLAQANQSAQSVLALLK
jgi:flagellin